MSVASRWFGRGTLLLAIGATAATASAEAPTPKAVTQANAARAQELHDEAAALYEKGEYRDAILRLEQALLYDPSGKELVYNLALIHERLGEVEAAEVYYLRYVDMETDAKLREKAQATIKRLEGAKKEIVHVAPIAPPAPLAPRAMPPAPLAPPPPQHKMGPWVVVLGATAATGVAVSSAFGLAAIVQNPGNSAHTGPGVSISDLDASAKTAHRDAVVADLSFAAGALAAGAAIYVYFATKPSSPRIGLAPVAPSIVAGPPRFELVSF